MAKPPAVLSSQGFPLTIQASWDYFGGFCLAASNVPPMAEGDYPITLVDGTGKTASGVIYYVTQVPPPPTVASVTPSYGSSRGYATVEVQGTGFSPKSQATADNMALKTKYISSSRLQVEIPPSAEMGRPLALGTSHNLAIQVVNPGTTSSDVRAPSGDLVSAYLYFAGIQVLGMDPSAPKAGELVTLSGQGLFKNMVLKIGNTVVPIQSFATPESNDYTGHDITFRMPALTPGSYALTAKIPEFDAVTYPYPIVVSTP
jgi:hypothetical protein